MKKQIKKLELKPFLSAQLAVKAELYIPIAFRKVADDIQDNEKSNSKKEKKKKKP